MIRIADYIVQRLKEVSDVVYMVTGGGAMHLNDAFGRGGMDIVFCHHEQACAMAAEGYARVTNKPAVVNVTTGPGGINALNGVFGAWVDSIPMLVVSGQVKRETLVATYGTEGGWRQLGDQEADIVSMVKGITKYAVLIDDPNLIRYHLEKAIYLACSGRMGPCWIDVPIDVQAMKIDVDTLIGFDPVELQSESTESIDHAYEELAKLINQSSRPVWYIGSGIHSSGTIDQFLELAEQTGIPVVTAWNSNDLIADEHPLYVGRPGTIGNRSGNFVVQSADLVIVLGSRLNIRLVSYNWKSFAPNAIKVGVDVDPKELNKPTCTYNLKICANLKDFVPGFLTYLKVKPLENNFNWWVNWGKERLIRYPVCLPEYWERPNDVNPYCFADALSDYTKENDVIVCADGTACVTTFQAIRVKPNQRIFHNSGCASMGYELPATIGVWSSDHYRERIICIAGDGSIMMNIQELQTISGKNIPAQIFIYNNQGYHSIRQTQHNFFKDNIVGCGTESGLTFPDFAKIAEAFDFPYYSISNHTELREQLGKIMQTKGRFICEVKLDLAQQFSPKLTSIKLEDGSMVTSPMENMWPFLPKEELEGNMIYTFSEAL
ncbi:thiamine pyrophosphate-binding protein [Arsenicibacter rosenii]|uniref:Acetolactate synthase n=1 Tax=Arsenicibacter rosenii TaxID=1750698 RepID=A0A1S2VC78_9BACT|nr:thiamine pyrophosphate-binding protein [Arsenicibacter rosenii]OIN56367.1 acetolactate synthase [Arsenicibacter rosenii]